LAASNLPTQSKRDTRQWEHRPKYGKRLLRQVGTNRFKSKVPDPARPGADRSKSFQAANWTEAEKIHRKRLGNVEDGLEPVASKVTLDELAERRWTSLEGRVASGERASGTLDADRILYDKHLRPWGGRIKVQKLTPSHVAELVAAKRREGYAPGTIARIYAVLRTLLNKAITEGLIVESPLKRLSEGDRPTASIPQTPARCLTDEECSRLIEHSLPSTRVLNAVYAFTGVRQAEGLGLVWDDLDLTNGTLRVQAQLTRKKRGQPARRVPLKGARRRLGARERGVDLHPDLVALLKRDKAAAFERGLAGAADFVFCTSEGSPLYYRNVLRDLGTAADRAGLNDGDVPRLSTHDLRHTAISRWIAAGLDEATVARMAGDTVEVIHSTYLHEFERARRAEEIREKLVAGTSIRIAS
jgi:integrase